VVLDLSGAGDGVDDTGKFDQQAVARGLYDSTLMTGDCGIKDLTTERFEGFQRADLVGSHEAAVTGDIRREHCCQSPFHALASQRKAPWRVWSAPCIEAYRGPAGLGPTCQEETHAPQQFDSLFDHPVGTGEKRRRQLKAKRLCGLEVDHKLEANHLNVRHVARIAAF
jgi:hypothetical protein